MENTPCRLCLEMLIETDLVILEDFEKNMLETLIPIVNLEVSCDTRICDKCTKMLQTSYDFKAVCLDNNERVKKLLILKEAFQVSNCKSCCCLCGFGVFEELDDETAINWKKMVEICIPELDIYSSDNLSACEKCIYRLKDMYKLVSMCLETEETIKRYFDTVTKNSEGKVKLYDILKTENDILTANNNGNVLEHEHVMEDPILESSTCNNAQETERHNEVDNVSQGVPSGEGVVENLAERGRSDGNSILTGNCGTATSNDEDGAPTDVQLDPTLMECSASVEEALGTEDSSMLIESSSGCEGVPETESHDLDNVSQNMQSDESLVKNSAEKGNSVGASVLNNKDGALDNPQLDPTLMECSTNVEEVLGTEAQLGSTISESSTGNEEVPEPERCGIDKVSQSIRNGERLVENSVEKGSSDGNSTLPGNCGTPELHNSDGTLVETQLDPALMECSTIAEDLLGPENSGALREVQLGSTLSKTTTGTEEVPESEREHETVNTQQRSSQQNAEKSRETLEHSAVNSEPSESAFQPAQKSLPRNSRNKSLKRFQCDKCSYGANAKAALVSHMMSHKTPSETTMYQCYDCGHATKRKGDLKAHMIIHRNSEELRMFKCPECPYESKRKCDLKQHAIVHQLQSFKCALCPFATANEAYLKYDHMLLHKDKSEVQMYKCDICPYETKIKHRLTRHVGQHKNTEVPTFACNWCAFKTKYKLGLKQHMVLHQCPSELTLFQCHMCGYKAKRKSDIKNHIFRHNNFRNPTLRCEKCEFQTKCKRSLQLHKIIHLDPSEATIYKCELCAYQARRKEYVKSHMLTHLKAKMAEQIDSCSK